MLGEFFFPSALSDITARGAPSFLSPEICDSSAIPRGHSIMNVVAAALLLWGSC